MEGDEAEEGEEEGGATADISQKFIYSKGEEISFLLPFERRRVYLGSPCFTGVDIFCIHTWKAQKLIQRMLSVS